MNDIGENKLNTKKKIIINNNDDKFYQNDNDIDNLIDSKSIELNIIQV